MRRVCWPRYFDDHPMLRPWRPKKLVEQILAKCGSKAPKLRDRLDRRGISDVGDLARSEIVIAQSGGATSAVTSRNAVRKLSISDCFPTIRQM